MTMTEYEKRLLAATPGKALTFLRTAATRVDIRAMLFSVGYSTEEQDLGWSLLQQSSGQVPQVEYVSDDSAARKAMQEADDWDEPGLRRVSAPLFRLHPEQHEFVFSGLSAARGAGSLISITTLLDRLDALESSPDRVATREADHAALATLAKRGIDAEERARLRALVKLAQTAAPPVVPEAAEQREQALLDLYAWYKDWSETARAVIHRRDYLVMLGVVQRRRRVVTEIVETSDLDDLDLDEPDLDAEDDDFDVPSTPSDVVATPAVAAGSGAPTPESAAS